MNTLETDIESLGGPQSLAREIGVTIQRVVNWRSRGRVPADMVLQYCERRGWMITPHQLRPDIYPHPDDGLPDERRAGGKAA